MRNFCKKCGKPLNSDGKCLNCDKVTSTSIRKKDRKPISAEKAKFIPRKNGKRSKFVIWALVILILCTVITLTLSVLVYINKINIPFINDVFVYMNIKDEVVEQQPVNFEEEPEDENNNEVVEDEIEDEDNSTQYKVTPPDADEYYNENSTVISETNAKDSQTISSESDVYTNFEERGFGNIPIVTNYSMDGEYLGDVEISRHSGTGHPMYQTYYITPAGNVWMILETNGVVMANPVSYNEQSSRIAPVIISETDTMMGYDSTLNKFYEIVPNSDVAILKKVDVINAETLEMLTNGEIDKL